ncbi:hypothetical protein BC939DRAFT_510420 [Gamsiella multidivaricata]|uniref:uncharacterized protein n=1 Tax=Gamsiella multidivaricata TaxID=101098 RepID=UPI00221FA926|nr:uncharacterized protein BC939DRAFT_510420 [Gamsiella multidivaricata]KAI7816762.1 hypothetical protein BC939DRAFT_510420 [Gamsiella multidivaricata]
MALLFFFFLFWSHSPMLATRRVIAQCSRQEGPHCSSFPLIPSFAIPSSSTSSLIRVPAAATMVSLSKHSRLSRRSNSVSSPLQVPELLEQILLHLSPDTLRSSCLHVSRQWFRIACTLLQRPLGWAAARLSSYYIRKRLNPHKVFLRLPLARSFTIAHSYWPSDEQNPPEVWLELLHEIRMLSAEERLRIKELSIWEYLSFHTQLVPLLACLGPSLTSLSIVMSARSDCIPTKIVELCPNLWALHIQARGRSEVLEEADEWPVLPCYLPLRSLKLMRTDVPGKTLLWLLHSCPDLDELCIIDPVVPPSDPDRPIMQ